MVDVCRIIATGALVGDACRQTQHDPDDIRRWAAEDETLATLYARARESQAHALAEQAIAASRGGDDIAQAVDLVLELKESEVGELDDAAAKALQTLLNSVALHRINRDKLRVETLKWYTAKVAPKLYGEKVQAEHSGALTLVIEETDSDE